MFVSFFFFFCFCILHIMGILLLQMGVGVGDRKKGRKRVWLTRWETDDRTLVAPPCRPICCKVSLVLYTCNIVYRLFFIFIFFLPYFYMLYYRVVRSASNKSLCKSCDTLSWYISRALATLTSHFFRWVFNFVFLFYSHTTFSFSLFYVQAM